MQLSFLHWRSYFAGRDMSEACEQEREFLLTQPPSQQQPQDRDQLSRSCKVTALSSAPLVFMVILGVYNGRLALTVRRS